MLRLLSIHACRECPQNAGLIKAADEIGEAVSIEPLLKDTPETLWATRNGLSLPLLVRADGYVSSNALDWLAPETAPEPTEAPAKKRKSPK